MHSDLYIFRVHLFFNLLDLRTCCDSNGLQRDWNSVWGKSHKKFTLQKKQVSRHVLNPLNRIVVLTVNLLNQSSCLAGTSHPVWLVRSLIAIVYIRQQNVLSWLPQTVLKSISQTGSPKIKFLFHKNVWIQQMMNRLVFDFPSNEITLNSLI